MRRLPFLFVVAVSTASAADFSDVQATLQRRCAGCHGAGQQMAGLRVDDPQLLLKGSHNGPVIVPGKATASKLIERVTSTKKGVTMPPAGEPLTPAEVASLRSWIDAGAAVPKNMPAAAAVASGPKRNAHWAFNPVEKPAVPAVSNRAWVRNEIDAFILARLEQEGIAPSPEASKEQ